jgi:cell division protein FtsB
MAFIEKYIIYILLAIIAALAVVGGVQYARGLKKEITITSQKANIEALNKDKADLQGQVADYRKGIASAKKAQIAQQKVADQMADLLSKYENMKNSAIIGVEDEKLISDLVYYFNSNGMRRADGSAETGGKVLPPSNTPNAPRPRWEVKRVAMDIIAPLIEGYMQCEKTVQCYGGGI